MEIKNTVGVSYRVTVDTVLKWKCISLSLAKKKHLCTLKRCLLSRKSSIHCSRHLKFLQLTYGKYTYLQVIHTVLFDFSMHHVRGTTMQATAIMKDLRKANYLSERTNLYKQVTLDVFTFQKPCQRDCE